VVRGVESRALALLLDDREGVMVRHGRQCVHAWYRAEGVPDSVRASFAAYKRFVNPVLSTSPFDRCGGTAASEPQSLNPIAYAEHAPVPAAARDVTPMYTRPESSAVNPHFGPKLTRSGPPVDSQA